MCAVLTPLCVLSTRYYVSREPHELPSSVRGDELTGYSSSQIVLLEGAMLSVATYRTANVRCQKNRLLRYCVIISLDPLYLIVANKILRYLQNDRRYIATQPHSHTDTRTHRHTDTQTHRHTDTHTHRHTDTQAHGHTDTRTHGHTDAMPTNV